MPRGQVLTAIVERRESVMIDFRCSHCGNEMHVKDESAGLKGKCKKCGNTVTVPAASELSAEHDIDDFLEVAEEATPVPAVRSQKTAARELSVARVCSDKSAADSASCRGHRLEVLRPSEK